MDASTIRQKFLDFFARHDHRVVPSASLVPQNDPTLYFTNAGMVPFKDVFIGEETRDYRRACSSQKCLRVSGKHNDLETVGRTLKHHTFFEMLGNFSFGDYFKEEAIAFGWRFLTEEMGLDPDRMVVSIFCGEDGIPADEASFAAWRKQVGIPAERIFRLGKADNFWAMGDVGPCGPCSEIHYLPDQRLSLAEVLPAGGPAVDQRWVEVWNLVFMQFNRLPSGELKPLERTGVDTGMGLERLSAIIQGVEATYDTDLLRPLIDVTAALANTRYGDDAQRDISLRVIADHARATAFCIADGVFPEKGGREYVLRRIMRRAICHGKRLGFEDAPFFDQVCAQVIDRMGDAYPELQERRELITKLVRAEEQGFRRTLTRGCQLIEEGIAAACANAQQALSAEFVGKMYDTFGFPIDLTRVLAEESGLAVNEDAARHWVSTHHETQACKVGDDAIATVYKQLAEAHGESTFVGYQTTMGEGTVLALLREGQTVNDAEAGEQVELLCAATPFYGRSGVQVGDTGVIRGPQGDMAVSDTIKPCGGLMLHVGTITQGRLACGDPLTLVVDRARRNAIGANHSATHLLHHALQEVLGMHVTQKGSEVTPTHLRFDFSHFEALTPEQRQEIERDVNAQIRQNVATQTEITTLAEARRAGAMALFGEKYGDRVRLVRMGGKSVELCGGTHVARSGDIGLFKLVSEESLALGVRRIVALTGADALVYTQQQEQALSGAARLLETAPDRVGERITRLLQHLKDTDAELHRCRRDLASGGGSDILKRVQQVAGINVLVTRVDDADPKVLREASDQLRDRLKSGLVVLGSAHAGKATLLATVTKDLVGRIHCGKLIAELAPIVGGKGGGRADMAQAGGPLLDRLDAALEKVVTLIS